MGCKLRLNEGKSEGFANALFRYHWGEPVHTKGVDCFDAQNPSQQITSQSHPCTVGVSPACAHQTHAGDTIWLCHMVQRPQGTGYSRSGKATRCWLRRHFGGGVTPAVADRSTSSRHPVHLPVVTHHSAAHFPPPLSPHTVPTQPQTAAEGPRSPKGGNWGGGRHRRGGDTTADGSQGQGCTGRSGGGRPPPTHHP